MSKTIRRSKGTGDDFWSRRCFGNQAMGYGPIAKEITRRKERQRNRQIEYDALVDPEEFEKRFTGE